MKRPSPSMIVALLALFVALGSTATAAKFLITSSGQIKDGAVQRPDLHANSVDGTKVVNNSLSLSDFDSASRAALQGGKAIEAFRTDGPESQPDGQEAEIATMRNIPAGTYVFLGKSVLSAPSSGGLLQTGQSVSGVCKLKVGQNADQTNHLIGAWAGNAPAGFDMQMTATVPPNGTASISCRVAGADWRASNTDIIALPVSGIAQQRVTG